MKTENIKQIITYLRSTLYVSKKTYYDDFSNYPRPFYNFLLMLEGEAFFRISPEKTITAKSGDIIWLPKGSTFYVEWRGSNASWYVIHFDFSYSFNPFINRITTPQKLAFPQPLNLLKDFQLLSNEKNPYLIMSTFYHVFGNLFSLIELKKDSQQKLIRPALNYLELHYKEKIYIEDLAAMCLMCRSKFQYLFKTITNMTPIAYKNLLIIQALQRDLILEPDKSLEDFVTEYCFDSITYMCRLFKKLTGKTPTEYRNRESSI